MTSAVQPFSFPRSFVVPLLTAVSAISLPHAEATSGTAVSATATHSNGDIGYNYQGYNTGLALGQTPEYSFTNPNITSAVTASVEAGYGVNRVFNSVSLPSGNSESAYGFLTSGWIDSLLISDPTLNGQQGTFNGVVYVDMLYDSVGTPAATYSNFFSVKIGSSIGSGNYAQMGFADTTGAQSYVNVPLSFSVDFTFGTPFDLAVTMNSNISLNVLTNGSGGSITHDAANTVTWGGFVSVQDEFGQVLDPSDYSVGSTSGTNYINAIPEPSAVALIASSAAALAFLRRRARS